MSAAVSALMEADRPRRLDRTQIESFQQTGFLILRRFFEPEQDLGPVVRDITALGRRICPDFDFRDGTAVSALDQGRRGTLYRSLRHLPSLVRLAGSETLLRISRDLGHQFPAVLHSFNIRMDLPGDAEHLFHWHQDIAYLLGSLNSLTFWIPLVETNARNGGIAVLPGSHRAGVLPVRYTGEKVLEAGTVLSPADLHLVDEPEEGGEIVETEPGDLVVFSQFLVHRSIPNRSRPIRWTVQIRHTDAFEPAFLDAGFPVGSATNIFFTRYLGDFVPG